MKNRIRNWLGLNKDLHDVATDLHTIAKRQEHNEFQLYEIFHALPFISGAMFLTAVDAAKLTHPHGIQANSLSALLTGIIVNARQGNSHLEVEGELTEEVREALITRGFKVENHTGTNGTSTFVIWT